MKIEIPDSYENYGDIDFVKHSGIFSKHISDTTYHVIEFINFENSVGKENSWFEVNEGYVDISEWNRIEEILQQNFPKSDEISDSMLATIIFQNHGAIEFGDERSFEFENEALDYLKSLFK